MAVILRQHETYDIILASDTAKNNIGLVRKTNYGKWIATAFLPTKTIFLPTEYESKELAMDAVLNFPTIKASWGIKE